MNKLQDEGVEHRNLTNFQQENVHLTATAGNTSDPVCAALTDSTLILETAILKRECI